MIMGASTGGHLREGVEVVTALIDVNTSALNNREQQVAKACFCKTQLSEQAGLHRRYHVRFAGQEQRNLEYLFPGRGQAVTAQLLIVSY